MSSSNQILANVRLFFAPLYPPHHPSPNNPTLGRPRIRVTRDYHILTDIGVFRPAYSASTKTAALFLDRHADRLEAYPNEDGSLEIAHKGRIPLVGMAEVAHGQVTGKDRRLVLNMQESLKRVNELLDELPDMLWEQACQIRISKTQYASGLMGYWVKPSEDPNKDQVEVNIGTSIDKDYVNLAIQRSAGEPQQKQSLLLRLFRACGTYLVKKVPPPPCLKVSRFDFGSGAQPSLSTQSQFKGNEWISALTADHRLRLRQLRRGVDPFKWAEIPLRPFQFASTRIRGRLKDLRHAVTDAFHLRREAIKLLTHVLLFGAHELITETVYRFTDPAEARTLRYIPKRWRHIIDDRPFRPILMNSDLHQTLLPTKGDQYGDLAWMDPERIQWHFDPLPFSTANAYKPLFSDEVPLTDERKRQFHDWVLTYLTSPYGLTVEFRDRQGQLVNPEDAAALLNETALASMTYSNGLRLYYDPTAGQKKLYAYYHRPLYATSEDDFPYDAARFLRQDRVLVFDLENRDKLFTEMPFKDFRKLIADKARLMEPDSADWADTSMIRMPTSTPASDENDPPPGAWKRIRHRCSEALSHLRPAA